MEFLKAIRKNNVKKVEKKLKKSFNPNKEIEEVDKRTKKQHLTIPLNLAVARGNTTIVNLLLNYDADINAKNADWSPPLHVASYYGHVQVLELLASRHADLQCRDSYGNTALHIAVESSKFDCAKKLLDQRIEVEATNCNSHTALTIAQQNRNDAMVKLIESYRVKLNMESIPTMRERLSSTKSTDFEEKERLRGLLRHLEVKEVDELLKKEQERLTNVNSCITNIGTTINDLQELIKEKQKLLDQQKQKKQGKEAEKKGIVLEIENLNAKKAHMLNNEEYESLECPICYEIPQPPRKVFQCSNGHVYCSECQKKPFFTKCPQCQVALNDPAIRNLIMEDLIASKITKTLN